MKICCLFLVLASSLLAQDLPKTLLTTRGKLLVSEDFTQPIAPFQGQTKGFASGFTGWCYRPGPLKHNTWNVADGVLTGTESAEAHHPATLSYGVDFKDVIIQCEVKLDDVPAEGRLYRSLFIKATDVKDYVCGVFVGPGGLTAIAYDDTRINPATKQRDKVPPVRAAATVKLNEWHTVVLEIRGDEMVGTLDGQSATCQNPLIAADKHSLMLGVGTVASFRHLRVWEGLPNPDWPATKASLVKPTAPVVK